MRAPNTAGALSAWVHQRTGGLPGTVVGWSLDGRDACVTAPPESAVLVLGPPRSGKTSAVLIPTVLMAPAPACPRRSKAT
jgi:hypothetical protein